MASKYFFPIYKSFVGVKLVCDNQTKWCLKDNSAHNNNSIYIADDTISCLLEAGSDSTFEKFEDLIVVRRSETVVLISDAQLSVFDKSVWSLFLRLIEKDRKGLMENPNIARDKKKLAKIALYHTFYERRYAYPLTRHEIMSHSLDAEDHTFYEKTLQRLLEKP